MYPPNLGDNILLTIKQFCYLDLLKEKLLLPYLLVFCLQFLFIFFLLTCYFKTDTWSSWLVFQTTSLSEHYCQMSFQIYYDVLPRTDTEQANF